MQKKLLIALLTFSTFAASAQSTLRNGHLKFKQTPVTRSKVALTGLENVEPVTNPNLPLLDRSFGSATLGQTLFDLQSNSSTPNRIAKAQDGTLYGTWTLGNTVPANNAYPDRGTGFNTFDPSSQTWGALPTTRIENVRTGWPNVVVLADGTVVTCSHDGTNIVIGRKVGSSNWTFTNVPSAVPDGILWPRMEVGGADGKTLHLIALAYPGTAAAPITYQGSIGHLLYYRSKDGGLTWDKQDVKLPEINSDYYKSMDADSYALDASGETVAVGLFGDYGDVKIAKSSDNGDTWTTYTVKDFPIDGYVLDSGYTFDQLPDDPDALALDSLAIRSSDNTGDVLVDNDGKVHLWYGEMFIRDDAAANSSYYPATMGLRYWNEDMAEDASVYAVEGIIDANGNDTLDITNINEIALYYSSLTSHPTAGIDEDGRIYVAYSSFIEDSVNPTSTPNANQHNRHVYVIFSEDAGTTWSDPLDIISETYVDDYSDLSSVIETMFPSMARNVGYRADIIFQQDYEPGLSVRGDADVASTNDINHIGLDVADLGIINNTTTVNPDVFAFVVLPNPTNGSTMLNYELATTQPVSITVTNVFGQVVKTAKFGKQNLGKHGFELNAENWAGGVYIVTLQAGDKLASNKLIVR